MRVGDITIMEEKCYFLHESRTIAMLNQIVVNIVVEESSAHCCMWENCNNPCEKRSQC
jgi:hypothetical protein